MQKNEIFEAGNAFAQLRSFSSAALDVWKIKTVMMMKALNKEGYSILRPNVLFLNTA
jgi:hypothetical protein